MAPRAVKLLVVVAVWAAILGTVAVVWKRRQVPVGSEQPATLTMGLPSGYVWIGEGDHSWCLAPGEAVPPATSRWDDGIAHSGTLSSGVIRFTSDVDATFVSDADGGRHPYHLVRMTTNRYGCHFDEGP